VSRPKRLAVLVVAVSAVTVVAFAVLHLRQRTKAKVTTHRIRALSQMLLAERPTEISDGVLRAIAAKYRQSDVLIDAWGRPLRVQMEGPRYIVTSYGRDGTSSGCCVAGEHTSPDTDLIAVDGEWRQVWN
jgi:hypothetical protein